MRGSIGSRGVRCDTQCRWFGPNGGRSPLHLRQTAFHFARLLIPLRLPFDVWYDPSRSPSGIASVRCATVGRFVRKGVRPIAHS